VQDTIEALKLSVDSYTLKGYGVASLPSGKEIEIAHAAAGDELLVEWRKKRRPPQKGRILEIASPSPDRVEPRCAHARVCGGCCWQQLAYGAQLREKEERVRKAFGCPVSPIIPAEASFGYRNKMEFTFSENRGGTRYLGLMIAQAEPYVFNLSECHLCPPWFSGAVNAVHGWWESSGLKAYYPPADEGTLRYLTLRHAFRTDQTMAVLNVSGRSEFAPSRAQLDAFAAAIQSISPDASIFLRVHQTKKGKPTQFYEMHLAGPDHIVEELRVQGQTLSFKISPASFFQPNTSQAEKLYDAALSYLPDASVVYDLYCGTGTLGMAAAKKVSKVISIDLSPESILDAEENLKRNRIENVSLHQGDVGKVLTSLMSHPGFSRPDAVIVDPPRAGLDPLALHHLKTLLPRAILYISCNPITQAANVQELLAAGYRLQALQPVDQFPHTYHIENIAFLAR
jgi:23S rRNA (uracil1939-C5)-methyltransferase